MVAVTQISYTYSGTNSFTVNFTSGFIDQAHVKCKVNEYDRTLNWINNGTVSINGVLNNGDSILIYRETPANEALNNFLDGQPLTENALDTNFKQFLLLLEERNTNDSEFSEIPSATTIDQLRAVEPTSDGQVIALVGHTITGYGGGLYRASLLDTTSVDNNNNIIVTAGGKRWKKCVDDMRVSDIRILSISPDANSATPSQRFLQAVDVDNASIELGNIRFVNGELIIENLQAGKALKIISKDNFDVILDSDNTAVTSIFAVKRSDGTVVGSIDEAGLIGGANINIASTGNIPTINTHTVNSNTLNAVSVNTSILRNNSGNSINLEELLNAPKDLTTPNPAQLTRVNGFRRATAVILPDGTILTQRGIASCTRNSTGKYTIVLNETIAPISYGYVVNIVKHPFYSFHGDAKYINTTTYEITTTDTGNVAQDCSFMFFLDY